MAERAEAYAGLPNPFGEDELIEKQQHAKECGRLPVNGSTPNRRKPDWEIF